MNESIQFLCIHVTALLLPVLPLSSSSAFGQERGLTRVIVEDSSPIGIETSEPKPGKEREAEPALQSFPDSTPVYGYEIINVYPHDEDAFTQGLVWRNGALYEGTGLYGASSLRKVDLETGEIRKIFRLDSEYFGEGITFFGDQIHQITWMNNVGFVYIELDTFSVVDTFPIDHDGWGLTNDDTCLIMSTGGARLYWLDPETHEEKGSVRVESEGGPVFSLNELEYIQGKIYANILGSDRIAVIEPSTGVVAGWLDLDGLLETGGMGGNPNQGVLNGIAFDRENIRLFVTGKLWPSLFEIEVEPIDYPPRITGVHPASPCTIGLDSTLVVSVQAEDPDGEDSLAYLWFVDDLLDTTTLDSSYAFIPTHAGTGIIDVIVSDNTFADSASWQVIVRAVGIDEDPPRGGTRPPLSLSLHQNYPNPFNPRTTISFDIPGIGGTNPRASLVIRDIRGRHVVTLFDDRLAPGRHRVVWDGKDRRGIAVPSGPYLCTLTVDNRTSTRKMHVLK